jgi:hypothetical protein
MNFLKAHFEEFATGLPPFFSVWSKTELKSPIQSHEASNPLPISKKESQNFNLSLLLGGA